MTNQTDPDNDDTIVTTTMTETAARDETDGHRDDDQRWAEAVIASLPSRSREARQALVEALWNGDAALPAPVGCANLPKPSRNEHLADAGGEACSTSVSHTDQSPHGATACSSAKSSSIACGTTVGGRGTRRPQQGSQCIDIIRHAGNCVLQSRYGVAAAV